MRHTTTYTILLLIIAIAGEAFAQRKHPVQADSSVRLLQPGTTISKSSMPFFSNAPRYIEAEGRWEGYYLDEMGCIPITLMVDSCIDKNAYGKASLDIKNVTGRGGIFGKDYFTRPLSDSAVHLKVYLTSMGGGHQPYRMTGELKLNQYLFLIDVEYFRGIDFTQSKDVSGLKGTLRRIEDYIFTEGPIVLWKMDK